MTDEQRADVRRIFEAACDLTSEAQDAYVREATTDAEVRLEVQRLLAFDPGEESTHAGVTEPPQVLQPGQRIVDRFEIVKLIGRGGVGEVYEARDDELGERVAIKTLRPEFAADGVFLRRFRREVQLARRVGHTNICRVYDVGNDSSAGERISFLTMEYLEGATLRERLDRGPVFSPGERLSLIRQLAAGLGALHATNIVHRDFKPGNVILVPASDGTVRAVLTDFGLARPATQEPDVQTVGSRASQGMWTPGYAAPEQQQGLPVSPATDVYAFGVVLYEIFSGQRPFGAVILLDQSTREGDAPWKPVVARCLQQRPEDRFASPAQAVAALEALADEASLPLAQSLKAHPAKAQPAWRWSLAVVLLLLLALAAVVLRVDSQRGAESADNSERQHVAILPLKTFDDDPELHAFADGLMEAITGRMSQFEGSNSQLLMVPASEVLRQRVTAAGDARQKFNVNYAIEGSLQQVGERVRLTMTLIDTGQMRQLETALLEQPRRNSIELQDGAVASIANLLGLHIQPEYVSAASEVSPIAPGAAEFVTQGRGYLQRSDQPKNIDVAISLFEKALALDDSYALAYAGMCEASWLKYLITKEPKLIERAEDACNSGMELNSGLAQVHITRGTLLNGMTRHEEAIGAFQRALELDRRNAEAHAGLGRAYDYLGRKAEAEAVYRQAVLLRRGDWLAYKELGLFYYRNADYDRAIEQYQRVTELTPDNAHGWANLGAFAILAGREELAREALETALRIEPTVGTLSNLGKLAIDAGECRAAASYYQRAAELSPRQYKTWSNLGAAFYCDGNQDAMREAFRKALTFVDEEIATTGSTPARLVDRAHYLAALGEREKAYVALEEGIRSNPTSAHTLAWAAKTYGLLADWPKVEEFVRRAQDAKHPMEELLSSPGLAKWPGLEAAKARLMKHVD